MRDRFLPRQVHPVEKNTCDTHTAVEEHGRELSALGLNDPCASLPAEDPVYALEAMDVSDTHMRHCQHWRFSIRSANICYWGQGHSRGPPPDTSVPSAGINGRCTQDCKGSPNPSWIRQLPHHPFSSQAKLDSTEGQWGGRTL